VQPPLSKRGSGFSQLEVPQLAVVDGRSLLLFSCLGPNLSPARPNAGEPSGVWVLRPDSLLGPYEVTRAALLTDESLYVGKLVEGRDGRWVLLAFVNQDADGAFVGCLSDPPELPRPLGSTLLVAAHTVST